MHSNTAVVSVAAVLLIVAAMIIASYGQKSCTGSYEKLYSLVCITVILNEKTRNGI